MYRALVLSSIAVALCSCGDEKIDESLVKGIWKVGKGQCGQGVELSYHAGNLSIYNESADSRVPVYNILSAERKGDEVWIQFVPVLTNKPAEVADIVFRIDGDKYVGTRLFSGQSLTAIPGAQQAFTWTRCSV